MPSGRSLVRLLLVAVALGSAWGPRVAAADTLQAGFDGVNSVTGNLSTWTMELNLLEPSWPVYLEHVYNSRNPHVGLTGVGWSSGLEWSLVDRHTGQVALTRQDGRRDVMTAVSGVPDRYADSRSGTYAQRLGDGSWAAVNELQGTLVLLYFDQVGRLTQLSAPYRNEILHFEYRDDDAPVRVSDDLGHAIAFEYGAGRLTRAVTPDGRSATYTYTPEGLLASITDPTGSTRSFAYDYSHRLAHIFDANGKLLEDNNYDALGRVVQQRDASGALRKLAYDGNNDPSRLFAIVDPRGHPSRLETDPAFHLTGIVDERGARVSYTYNDKGVTTSYTDRNGNFWQFDVDATGRRTGVTDPVGGLARFIYSDAGRLIQSIDPSGGSWMYGYDDSGTLTHIENSTGGVVHIERQDQGRTVVLSGDNGEAARFVQDLNGRILQIHTPDGDEWNVYDELGQLTQVSNGSTSSALTYDGAGHLLTVDGPEGQLRFVYDAHGAITDVSDPVLGTVHFQYDPRRMLVSANTDDGEKVAFEYDENRNRTIQTDSRGRTVRFGYDERNDIAAVVDPNGGTWSMTYDGNGNLVSAADPQGRLATFTYTFRNELQMMVDRSGTTSRFGYDPGGHLLADPTSQGTISDGPLGLAIRPNISMVPDPLSGQARRVTDARDAWTAQADLHLDPGTNNRTQAPLERVLVPMRSLARLRYGTDGALAGWQSDVADPASFEGKLTRHLQAVINLVSGPRTSLMSVVSRLLHPVYEPITTTTAIR